VLQDYAYMCEEAYLSGSLNLTLEPFVITDESSSPSLLHLPSIGLMKVNSIHKLPLHCIQKVLFDMGSDISLINKHALPKQAISAKDPVPSCIIGLHGSKPLDCFVWLNGMQFPEFSPTTKVAKPIKAIVFNNPESNYDVIVGMDILQPIGFRIDCATLTISWN
jgi:hypothetical protein